MTAPALPPNKPLVSVTRSAARVGRLRPIWALGLIALGALLLLSKLGVLRPEVDRAVQVAWPAALVAAGIGLVVAGWRGQTAAPATFAMNRGEYAAGLLVARTGLADLHVGAFAGASQLAVGQFPGQPGPRLDVDGGEARLRLEPSLALAIETGGCWSASLSKSLPWRLALQSSLGDLTLNLRDLAVRQVSVRSLWGHVDLTLPATGQAEVDARLVFGNLTVRVPEGMAVRVKLEAGPLATVDADDRRFAQLAAGEWGTPLFAVSGERCSLRLRLTAGDLRLV